MKKEHQPSIADGVTLLIAVERNRQSMAEADFYVVRSYDRKREKANDRINHLPFLIRFTRNSTTFH
jgi:hypothetical protein